MSGLVRGTRGTVACGHPLGCTVAIATFDAGGNAVDAALAAAAALTVVLPDACGLGGDCLALVDEGDGRVTAYNGSGRAPRILGTTGGDHDAPVGPGPDDAGRGAPAYVVPPDGGGTVAVPGAVDAFAALHAAHAALPLTTLFAPAVRLARDGFPIGDGLLRNRRAQLARLQRGAPAWELTPGDPQPGARLALPTLATTLERIAAEGPAAFYGDLAAAIAAVSHLRPDDLGGHDTVVKDPVRVDLANARLMLQPPISQGVLAGMILQAVERAEGDRTHLTIEAVEAAFAHRDAVAGEDAQALLAIGLDLDPDTARRLGGPTGYSHTTAIATADGDGHVVSMLISVFDDFGSAVLVPEGGFLLNDRLVGFAADPTSPNAAAPGRRPVHTLAPALIDQGDRRFALATPGADGQVQTLAQLYQRVVDDGAPIADALAEPRWRSNDGELLVEQGFDGTGLVDYGHALVELGFGHGLFGAAVAAGTDAGSLFAAADPRRDTWAAAC